MSQIAQTQSHHLAQRMRHLGQFFQIQRRIDLHVAKWIEVLDRHVELLGKELRGVRHDRGPAREK